MGDFHQHGLVTTLHQLNQRPLEKLEEELMEFNKERPMALILPSLFSELEGPALSSIVDELSHVEYLSQIVVGLDRADEGQFKHALQFFDRLALKPNILWNDGPRLQKIDKLLQAKGLAPKELGKGRNVWYMFGYILASKKAQTVAIHDCDITTYDRSMLAQLIYPVANPSFSYKFCKGYYARVANQSLNGRVCRLLVTPLLRALKKVCGDNTYVEFLDSFRYPLAGEFSLQRDVIEDIRIPSDWGLEMGILSEIHRNYATNQVCQVDIADIYDHKHQDLSLEDKTRGLSKMSADIAKSVFRKMATQGEVFTTERIRTLKATYYRIALDLIDSYASDAAMNGLRYDMHMEGAAVENFAQSIMEAGQEFLDPAQAMDTPFMPSWKRVVSAEPNIMEMILDAVEGDQREHGEAVSYDPSQHPKVVHLRQRIDRHVGAVYGDDVETKKSITDRIFEVASLTGKAVDAAPLANKWDHKDILAITYADSLVSKEERPLLTLKQFFKENLRGCVDNIHILPFCPYSSDDGFSVINYSEVNPDHGTWEDIQALRGDFRIMADLVLNHCSSESEWFKNFLEDKDPGKGYFIDASRFKDLSNVIRPRSSPLLTTVKTVDGEKEVWCTFSADQVDLDFSNPDVLLEMIRVIRLYIEKGISIFRLDAVAYLWKKDGTSCVHLAETHEVIKLLRIVIEHLDPGAIIITETNVPNKENLSYFGNDNEAHLIYNFSLPPLLLHALLSGSCKYLKRWIMSMPPAKRGRAYLNFIASHDGIGLRPAEGLLSEGELESLTGTLKSFGGEISMRRTPEGDLKPYEANISLFSAMAGTIDGGEDSWQIQRFLCAHIIMLALEGLPAFYIHSLLGTENDIGGMNKTGHPRSINRYSWDVENLQEAFSNEDLHHKKVFDELKRIIGIRREQEAFHPNATQYTMHFGNQVFAFWRESLDRSQSVFALHNVSNQPQSIAMVELNLISTDRWCDLLSGNCYTSENTTIELPPYGCVWLTNKH